MDLEEFRPWAEPDQALEMTPLATVPILIDRGRALSESSALVEYLEELRHDPPALPGGAADRAEARRLQIWFDTKFHQEVTANLLYEKIYKRLKRQGEPDTAKMRAGRINLKTHMDYISFLADRNNWLAGDDLSVADFTAAAHLSSLDYIDMVPWAEYPVAKAWYQRLKSRPSFRPILADHLPGLPPPYHYADLDF